MHSLAAAVGNQVGKEAEELCASGQCAAAAVALKLAVDLGHLPSRALLGHMMMDGREGVALDRRKAIEVLHVGSRLGCHHCSGVLGWGCMEGFTDWPTASQHVEFARGSAGKGSRYGQCNLGAHYETMGPLYYVQAVELYRLAAAQNLDSAQHRLGRMHGNGFGVAKDSAEALRFYRLAAAQGHPQALYDVAACFEKGKGVRPNRDEAICWYKRAQAAGHIHAEFNWPRLAQLPPQRVPGKPAPRP
jgi:TPR repeat protein